MRQTINKRTKIYTKVSLIYRTFESCKLCFKFYIYTLYSSGVIQFFKAPNFLFSRVFVTRYIDLPYMLKNIPYLIS